jgi:uncharacterized protein YmfQ (DUF2313 family)
MTKDETQALIDQRLDATIGLTLLALMEQMVGIVPSTFDQTNQQRVDAIVAKLTAGGVSLKGATFTGVIQ